MARARVGFGLDGKVHAITCCGKHEMKYKSNIARGEAGSREVGTGDGAEGKDEKTKVHTKYLRRRVNNIAILVMEAFQDCKYQPRTYVAPRYQRMTPHGSRNGPSPGPRDSHRGH